MKKSVNFSLFSLSVSLVLTLFSCNEQIPKVNLKTNIDSAAYAEGVLYASQVEKIFARFGLDEANKTDFIKGFRESFQADPKNKKENAFMLGKMIGYQIGTQFIPYFNEQLLVNEVAHSLIKENFLAGYIAVVKHDSNALLTQEEAKRCSMIEVKKANIAEQYSSAKKENLDFLEKNKSKKGVIVLPSGLQYKVIKKGKGPKPTVTDVVKVNYSGTNIKGEVFNTSSLERGGLVEVSLSDVIKGWTEGIQLMSVGSKYIFYIPYHLAYGDQFKGNLIVPYSTLIFEIELHEIVKKAKINKKN